jgi:DNA-binding MarR family transcriptional regulator
MKSRRPPEPDGASAHSDDADRGPLLGALLRLAHQTLTDDIVVAMARAGYHDVLPAHSAALRPLWDHPEGLRSTELASAARITKQSMGTIIDQLEATGYVERVDDPYDRRAKLVRLTRRGRTLGRELRAAVRAVEVDWARRVGAERVELLRATLSDLLASFDERD